MNSAAVQVSPQVLRAALVAGLSDPTARNLAEIRATIARRETRGVANQAMQLYEEIAGRLDSREWVCKDFALTYLVAMRHLEAAGLIGPAFEYEAQIIKIRPGKGPALKKKRPAG